MARISSKKSLKKGVKPVDISVPDYSGSNVQGSDLVLINRNKADYNTDVDDLAAGIGASLQIDKLVGEIQNEIDGAVGDINTSIDGLQTDLSDLEGKVAQNTADISANAGDISTNASNISTNADGISTNAGNISTNTGNISTNAGNISTNTGNISANAGEIAALKADQARQDSWTGAQAGTNADANATHAARIGKAEADILALQGALVYRGVGDFTQAPPTPVTGDFYLCGADGTATGWAGLGTVKETSYYAYNGSQWEEAGSNSVVIPDPGAGALTLTSGNKAIDVAVGSGFNANSAGNVEYQIAIDLNDEGGLEITDDGIGIHPKPGNGIIVDGDGISVDEGFIAGIAGPVPALQAVTDVGAITNKAITAAGVISTAAQSASTFLHKDISQLPSLP